MVHLRTRSYLLAALAAAALSCDLQTVWIEDPTGGAPLLAPDVDVRVHFTPRVRRGETLQATLLSGFDAVEGGMSLVDVTDDLALAADSSTATLPLRNLPPGRSTLRVDRVPPLGKRRGGRDPTTRDPSFDVLTLDRGGFTEPGAGPFGVGVRLDELVRPSTAVPGTDRTLSLFVWYPTDDPDAPATGDLGGALDAPLATGAAALPTLIFSHGSCGIPNQSTFLARALARAGYLMVAVAHTGNTAGDPNCSAIVNLTIAFVERPVDVRVTLDWVLAQSADPTSFLYGAVDPDRLGITGHSFGGQTSVRAAGTDPRYRAALPLAPEYQFTAPLLAPLLPLPIPTMVQGGLIDTITPYVPNQVALYGQLAAPRFLVGIENTGHLAFSDHCAPINECAPGTLTQDEAHAFVLHYALGFLGHYVAGDRRWLSLIEPIDGVQLTEER